MHGHMHFRFKFIVYSCIILECFSCDLYQFSYSKTADKHNKRRRQPEYIDVLRVNISLDYYQCDNQCGNRYYKSAVTIKILHLLRLLCIPLFYTSIMIGSIIGLLLVLWNMKLPSSSLTLDFILPHSLMFLSAQV